MPGPSASPVAHEKSPLGRTAPGPESCVHVRVLAGRSASEAEAVNDTVAVEVGVKLNKDGVVKMALIDLGVPTGFTVLTEDLSRLVEQGVIARYELTGRQIIIYLEDFSSQMPLRFSYRLRARFPMRAQTPASSAYDYYNPSDLTVRAPVEVVVE